MVQTGMHLNNGAKIRVRVRIEAPGVDPFEAGVDDIVPVIVLRSLLPGNLLPVFVDPADPQRFEIQWLGKAQPPPPPVAEATNPTVDNDGHVTAPPAPVNRAPAGYPDPAGHAQQQPLPPPSYVEPRPSPSDEPPSPQAQPQSGYADPWARLTKLHAMRNDGTITEAEFEEHKRRILSEI